MPRALIALGANLGQRHIALTSAIDRLSQNSAISSPSVSTFHETLPVGGPAGQAPFLNAAASFETSLTPDSLHALLQQIEIDLGRQRGEKWEARLIDLDLLLYNEQVICTPQLQIPHPRMAFRRFVLEPATEVAPKMVHPLVGWSIERLLEHLRRARPYVAILGSLDSRAEELAAAAAARVGADCLSKTAVAKHVTSRTDPSGRAPTTPIQFLDHAASMLAGYDWSSGRALISGFYLDRLLAEARVEMEKDAFTRFEQAWRQQHEIAQPKLLVVLDSWEAMVGTRGDTPGRFRRSLDPELLQLAARGGQPVLCAGSFDFEAQLTELAAAMIAMQ